MKASHTLEQRQAAGIGEDLVLTSGSKSKLNSKMPTLVFNNLAECFTILYFIEKLLEYLF